MFLLPDLLPAQKIKWGWCGVGWVLTYMTRCCYLLLHFSHIRHATLLQWGGVGVGWGGVGNNLITYMKHCYLLLHFSHIGHATLVQSSLALSQICHATLLQSSFVLSHICHAMICYASAIFSCTVPHTSSYASATFSCTFPHTSCYASAIPSIARLVESPTKTYGCICEVSSGVGNVMTKTSWPSLDKPLQICEEEKRDVRIRLVLGHKTL